ncbi:glycosyltransferase [Paenibacillus sp. S150]|uniref:glycosyltransferase n=1 Tax=Paenibacillus sp. S150 TaxID=2749826 RepID=UPI001C59FDC4|nr:glycosyltransferase family 2 protein [Paenibacillus sp. S150]MBW4084532.1 glycosyltransferase family 2 protein [Paenibacillus sp. S150]
MKLAVVILNWNGWKDTLECVKSLLETNSFQKNIFILDNGSSDDSKMKIREFMSEQNLSTYYFNNENFNVNEMDITNDKPKIMLIESDVNFGFAIGNNFVVNKIKKDFEYILLLNNDTVVTENAIDNMLDFMDENINISAVTCDIRFYDDREKLWNAGGRLKWYGDRKYYTQKAIDRRIKNKEKYIDATFITGCALLIRVNLISVSNIFTERFFFGEEDFNFCRRMKRDKRKIGVVLDSVIYHKVSSSINKMSTNKHKFIIHFSNRIVDNREFYTKKYWLMWRLFYLALIFVKLVTSRFSFSESKKIIGQIQKYSLYESIGANVFKEIREANI